jgi:hypothetical protein
MSRDMVYEEIPLVSRRAGDNIFAGQNNSTILLGRDRFGSVDTGYGAEKDSGAMHLIVGRKTEDPSVMDDAASGYLSTKTDPDAQAGTSSVGQERKAVSAVIFRADCVRIVPRTDFKISVGSAFLTLSSDGKVVIEGDVQLGKDAAERIIRGDAFREYWSGPGHTHPTPSGLSGPPQQMPDSLLSPRNKVT